MLKRRFPATPEPPPAKQARDGGEDTGETSVERFFGGQWDVVSGVPGLLWKNLGTVVLVKADQPITIPENTINNAKKLVKHLDYRADDLKVITAAIHQCFNSCQNELLGVRKKTSIYYISKKDTCSGFITVLCKRN